MREELSPEIACGFVRKKPRPRECAVAKLPNHDEDTSLSFTFPSDWYLPKLQSDKNATSAAILSLLPNSVAFHDHHSLLQSQASSVCKWLMWVSLSYGWLTEIAVLD